MNKESIKTVGKVAAGLGMMALSLGLAAVGESMVQPVMKEQLLKLSSSVAKKAPEATKETV